MSTGLRVERDLALAAASEIVRTLTLFCHRIEIAGSIRRGREDVGDIEIVAVPVIETEPDGMFGAREANRLTEAIDKAIVFGLLASHPTDPKRGERYSKLVHRATGLQVDLFSATRDSFGIIYLIRTGPAAYSHRFVTEMRRRQHHVAEGQLHRGSLGCGTYACEVVPTPTEADVYGALGLPPMPPEMRA